MATPSLYTLVDTQTAVTAATVTGTAVSVNQREGNMLIFRLVWTCNSGTPTLDVKIQHAPLSDGTYTDLVSFTQATTGTGTYEVHVPRATMGVFECVRAVGTLAGTSPNYTYTVHCWAD